MRSRGGPLVPVLVHQVGYYDAACFLQIWIFILCAWNRLHLCHKQNLRTIRGETKALHITLIIGELLFTSAIGIHLPYLTTTAFAGEICQFAVIHPHRLSFSEIAVCDLIVFTAIGSHDEEFAIATVLWYAVI